MGALKATLNLFRGILALAGIIFLANFSLKLLGKYTKQGKLIKILDRTALSKESNLSIIEICGKYYLISSSNSNTQVLDILDKEKIELLIEENKKINLDKNFELKDILKNLGERGNRVE